ncbi:MAG TPA: type II secretion system F family protein [Ilumatobacteraceae bacterium]|jgi:type IV pilus assembly protein PilC|nr:type II secretion system F family protein [Ilumatobacteraceae bacterium]
MSTTYAYKVRDKAGAVHKGSIEGQSEQLVVAKLRELGYVPVSVTSQGKSKLSADVAVRGGGGKIGLRDIVVFSRQLATMVGAGLTLIRALGILAEQTESKPLAEVIRTMRSDIEKGLSFSQAISKHPKAFPEVYIAMVRSGEVGGMIDLVLLRLATMLEAQLELRRRVKSAMSYPIAVGGIIVVIVSAMLLFIVPMFETMYKDLGGELPLPTKVLIGLSNFLTTWWWLIAIFGVGTKVGLKRWRATPTGRLAFDHFKLRLPIMGSIVLKTALARFCQTLAALARSGVSIMEALDIVAGTAGNAVIGAAIADARERVRVGESVSVALANHPVFPQMVVQMMAVGEETGALDEMLEKIGEFYDSEVSATVDALTSLIEPLLMVVMGITVGGMVVSLYMPMFQIINLVK